MAVHRIFLPDLDATDLSAGGAVEVTGDEAHHALSVKRVAVSDAVELLNGRGVIARGAVVSTSKKSLTVQVEASAALPRPTPEIIIAAAAPKGPRAEAMIEQMSQIGVSRWIPLVTERSVVEPRDKRIAKWRIATVVESAKQCGRAWLMEIDEPTTLSECLARADQPRLLLADADGRGCRESLGELDSARPILLLVGPEGGFSDAERQAIAAAGATPISLGPHILRLETAAAVGAAAIAAAIASSG